MGILCMWGQAINPIVPSTPDEQEEFDLRAAKNERARLERSRNTDVGGANTQIYPGTHMHPGTHMQ